MSGWMDERPVYHGEMSILPYQHAKTVYLVEARCDQGSGQSESILIQVPETGLPWSGMGCVSEETMRQGNH